VVARATHLASPPPRKIHSDSHQLSGKTEMTTFVAVNDKILVQKIQAAKKRVVYVAPGISTLVAEIICQRITDADTVDITVVLDPDDDVYRIGYGDGSGLKLLHDLVSKHLFLRSQSGIRIGVLLVDDDVLIWSPTPQSIEAAPDADISPNGLFLGKDPASQLSQAVAAEGTNTVISGAEIGKEAITPDQVEGILEALKENPPVDVDLSRVTRVFNSKFQFVEPKVKNANLSKRQFKVPSDLLNADATMELQEQLDTKLKAFEDFKDEAIPVPIFLQSGDPCFDKDGKQVLEPKTEADLDRVRQDIERMIYDVAKFGRIIERTRKVEFEKRFRAYKQQLDERAKGMKDIIEKHAETILEDTIKLIVMRSSRSDSAKSFDEKELRETLEDNISQVKDMMPEVTWVFKDITYEQTQSEEFLKRLRRALPSHVSKRLGDEGWFKEFDAVHVKRNSKQQNTLDL